MAITITLNIVNTRQTKSGFGVIGNVMHDENAGRLDLNLLSIFDAIMLEGSLTKAGKRLGMTQSAVSQALARLHEATGGDVLFERTGHGMRPTPAAIAMHEKVRDALDMLHASVRAPGGGFCSDQDDRMFMLDLPVGIDTIIVPAMMRRLGEQSKLRFRVSSGRAGGVLSELRLGESSIALDHLLPEAHGYRAEPIIDDPFVLMTRKKHPDIDGPITLSLFQSLSHDSLTWSMDRGPSPLTERLSALGIVRKISYSVPCFATIPAMVETSNLVSAMPLRLAREFARRHALDLHVLPDIIPSMTVYMVWHERFDADDGHKWLRRQLREVCDSL